MNLTIFKQLAETNHWLVIWPEISLAVLAIAILILDLFAPKLRKCAIPGLAILGQVAILTVFLVTLGNPPTGSLFSGMIQPTEFSNVMLAFFLLTSILVSYIGIIYLKKHDVPRSEFFIITILISASMMLLVASSDFVMLFVALETVTVGFYVLCAYNRESAASLESGLKFLIMGALSSSILLFGIVLLYGAAGNPSLHAHTADGMNFVALAKFISVNSHNTFIQIGSVLVICGLAFKIGAVPFQIWIPDVYQGAPTPVTSFLAVASKAAGIAVLVNLLRGPFLDLSYLTYPLLSAICAVTILFGNITALGQRNVKRIVGLSGIAHAGYLLLAVVALIHGVEWAVWAIVFYLFTYLFGSFSVFGVMAHVAGSDDSVQEVDHYHNLTRNQPFLAGVLAIGLGSLAGIPPLAGFIGKVSLFVAAFKAGLFPLLGIAIAGVVISIYYYFGWIREAFFKALELPLPEEPVDEPEAQVEKHGLAVVSIGHRIVLSVIAIITVVLGVYQGFLGKGGF